MDNLDHIHEGSEVNLKVQIDQLRTLRFRAVVVRKLRAREQDYPSGLGLKFQGIDRETKKQLRSQLP